MAQSAISTLWASIYLSIHPALHYCCLPLSPSPPLVELSFEHRVLWPDGQESGGALGDDSWWGRWRSRRRRRTSQGARWQPSQLKSVTPNGAADWVRGACKAVVFLASMSDPHRTMSGGVSSVVGGSVATEIHSGGAKRWARMEIESTDQLRSTWLICVRAEFKHARTGHLPVRPVPSLSSTASRNVLEWIGSVDLALSMLDSARGDFGTSEILYLTFNPSKIIWMVLQRVYFLYLKTSTMFGDVRNLDDGLESGRAGRSSQSHGSGNRSTINVIDLDPQRPSTTHPLNVQHSSSPVPPPQDLRKVLHLARYANECAATSYTPPPLSPL
ncbi:hypothetical protein BDZ97DRAFT_1754550 [Flammula alnicola]|nr:hypothetical protein BDZ97DRAFT_1754550 [Flammula alnicola]